MNVKRDVLSAKGDHYAIVVSLIFIWIMGSVFKNVEGAKFKLLKVKQMLVFVDGLILCVNLMARWQMVFPNVKFAFILIRYLLVSMALACFRVLQDFADRAHISKFAYSVLKIVFVALRMNV